MKLSEMLSKLRTKVEALASKLDGADASELNASLAEITRQADRVQADLTASNGESAERRIKIGELETQLAEKTTKITELEGRPDPVELQNTITAQNTKISGLMKGQRDNFGNRFQAISKHPNFENIKSFLKLPDPDDKGVYDLSKMTEEDLDHNLAKVAEYDQAKLFGEVKLQNAHGAPRQDLPAGGGQPVEIKTEADIAQQIENGLKQY